MPTFRVAPDRHATPSPDSDRGRLNALFRGRVIFPWDQVLQIQGALVGMAEQAREGLAAGTNRAAAIMRDDLVGAIAGQTTLPRSRVAAEVHVFAEATPQAPAAGVRIEAHQQPLSAFESWEADGGVYAIVERAAGARYLEGAFFGKAPLDEGEIYQRQMEDNARAGRLPIAEKHGPSVAAIAADAPGLLQAQIEQARATMVQAISDERDRIITEFLNPDRGPGALRIATAPVRLAADLAEIFL